MWHRTSQMTLWGCANMLGFSFVKFLSCHPTRSMVFGRPNAGMHNRESQLVLVLSCCLWG